MRKMGKINKLFLSYIETRLRNKLSREELIALSSKLDTLFINYPEDTRVSKARIKVERQFKSQS